MDKRFVAVSTAALLAVAGFSACGSEQGTSPQPPGSLPPVTAQVTINGSGTGPTHSVQCNQMGWAHTITSGDNNSGVTAVVDAGAGGITAQSVQITNVGGFTGAFWRGNVGNGTAKIIGTTFSVSGQAEGAYNDAPTRRVTASFDFRANC